jgi:hypothetical protein
MLSIEVAKVVVVVGAPAGATVRVVDWSLAARNPEPPAKLKVMG